MNWFQIGATCLLALTASLAAGEMGASRAGCLERVAGALRTVAVPRPVLELSEAAESDWPLNGGELNWSQLEESERVKYAARYPQVSCPMFTNQVDDILERLLADDNCALLLESDEEALREAHAHPLLGPVLKAKEACFAFEPHTAAEGLQV